MKLLILWPSGNVESSSSGPVVRRRVWESVTEDMNRGDLFVYEATLRVLDFEEFEEVPWSLHEITEEMYDRYARDFDYLIIRGSNYIRNDGGLGDWLPFFKRIQIPILAFGVGTQAPSEGEKIDLKPEIVEALKVISEKSVHSIGVRGQHTAKLLNGLGIKNVTVIGCPSIFREKNPNLHIEYRVDKGTRFNFTTHPYLGGLYTRDAWHSRIQQVKLIRKLRSAGYSLCYLTQGIAAETKIAYKKNELDGIRELKEIGWFDDDEEFVADFSKEAVCFETADEYYRFSATGFGNIGTRLHGNITALAMGRPAIFVAYDTRTTELAEHFSIPILQEDEITDDFSAEDFMKSVSFDSFNQNFHDRYRTFVKFLDDNKVSHLMPPA